MSLIVLLSACANPEREHYEQALAAAEREEQRQIARSRDATGLDDPSSGQPSDNSAEQQFANAADNRGNIANTSQAQVINEARSRVSASDQEWLDTLRTVIYEQGSAKGAAWWVQAIRHPGSGATHCLVISRAHRVEQDSQASRVQLVLSETSLLLRTDAQIVSDASQVLLSVDSHTPIAFERAVDASLMTINRDYTSLLNQLLTGRFVTVNVTIRVGNNVPNLHVLEFDMKDFIPAYARIDTCSV